MRALIPTTVLLLVAGCRSRSAEPAPRPPDPPATTHAAAPAVVDAIDRLARDAALAWHSPGLSVAVVSHGQPLLVRGYGTADVASGAAVTATTVFRVGSISKQFAAAAVVRLAAAGRLRVDETLATALPSFAGPDPAITVHQLLTHTSGLRDYEHAPWLQAHMDQDRPAAELEATLAAAPLDFAPGSQWSYSNTGYFLLAQIIEARAGRRFSDELDALLAASGVAGVRYCPDAQDYPDAARGYTVGADGRPALARPILMKYATAAGALCATASGLVAWARALASGAVVGKDGWQAMTTPVTLTGGGHFGYGLGLFVGELGGHRRVFHNGGINGFAAKLSIYPDDDLVVAVLANVESADVDVLDEAIGRAVLALPPRTAAVDLPIDPAEAAAIAGRYRVAVADATLVIEAEGAALFVSQLGKPGRVALRRQADGRYLTAGADEVLLRVVRAGDRVTGLELEQGGMTFPGQRLP